MVGRGDATRDRVDRREPRRDRHREQREEDAEVAPERAERDGHPRPEEEEGAEEREADHTQPDLLRALVAVVAGQREPEQERRQRRVRMRVVREATSTRAGSRTRASPPGATISRWGRQGDEDAGTPSTSASETARNGSDQYERSPSRSVRSDVVPTFATKVAAVSRLPSAVRSG